MGDGNKAWQLERIKTGAIELLSQMESQNEDGKLRSREFSLAITKLEECLHRLNDITLPTD